MADDKNVINDIADAAPAVGGAILDAGTGLNNASAAAGSAVGNAINNAAPGVGTAIGNAAPGVGSAIGNVIGGVGSGVGGVISGVGTGIGNAAPGVGTAIGNAAPGVGTAVGNVIGGTISGVGSAIGNAATGIGTGIGNAINSGSSSSSHQTSPSKPKPSHSSGSSNSTSSTAFGKAIDGVIDKGKQAVSDQVDAATGYVYDNTIGAVEKGITNIGNSVVNSIEGIGNKADELITKPSVLDQSTRPTVDESSAGLLEYVKSHGLGIGAARVSQNEKYNKFARYERLDPHNWLGSTREYIFFTTPDLQLFKNNTLNEYVAKNSLMVEAYKRYTEVLKSLSYSACGKPFVNLLSNYKRSNVDIPDINTSSDYETSKNILGSSIFYRGTSYEADENHEFSVEFEDTRYLEVYMWFRLFDEYERMKHYGLIDFVDDSYLDNKIIHDQMAMYKFIVGDDGESIIHYSKYYGVYPKNVPRGTFSDLPADGNIKFTINFKSSFVEDMDPNIIHDFNEVARKIPPGDPKLGGYIDRFGGWSGEFMQRPYILIPNSAVNVAGGTGGKAVNAATETSGSAYNKVMDTVNNLKEAKEATAQAEQSANRFVYYQDPKYLVNYGYNDLLPNKGFYKLKWEG